MTSVLGGRDAVITGLSVEEGGEGGEGGREEGRKGGREEGREGGTEEGRKGGREKEIQVYEKNRKPGSSRYELSPSDLSQ